MDQLSYHWWYLIPIIIIIIFLNKMLILIKVTCREGLIECKIKLMMIKIENWILKDLIIKSGKIIIKSNMKREGIGDREGKVLFLNNTTVPIKTIISSSK